MIWRIARVSAPLKAWNGAPGSALIATGAPVIAAWFAGSMYIAKRRSAGAGRTTDWGRMLPVGHSPSLQNPEPRSAPAAQGQPERLLRYAALAIGGTPGQPSRARTSVPPVPVSLSV